MLIQRNRPTGRRLSIGVALLAFTVQAGAQVPKQQANPAADQALKKAQGMLRQLSEEKASWQAEKTALQAQVDKLAATVKQLEPLQGEVERHKASVDSLRADNGTLQSQLQHSRRQEQELKGKWQETVAQAKALQADNEHLLTAVKEREQRVRQCSDNNRQLTEAGQVLMEKFQNKGFWERLSEAEPLTGIGNVETETALQDYRFKLEALKVTPF